MYLNFAELDRAAVEKGPFDFLLADLGVSSMQIDDPSRGFSYKREGPLDLRLDQSKGETAAERLAGMDRDEIEGMLTENADEPYAAEIAKAITASYRKKQKIETTTELAVLVEEAVADAVKGQEGLKKADIALQPSREDPECTRTRRKSCHPHVPLGRGPDGEEDVQRAEEAGPLFRNLRGCSPAHRGRVPPQSPCPIGKTPLGGKMS